ncbi:MAG: hypothetical protein HY556_04685 [Euryarchaeota archaeon]|nr:hypothetical protein [Euryarchaeota archaeon]
MDHVCAKCQADSVSISAVDLSAHPEAGNRFRIQSSPTVVLDSGAVVMGLPTRAGFHELATG